MEQSFFSPPPIVASEASPKVVPEAQGTHKSSVIVEIVPDTPLLCE